MTDIFEFNWSEKDESIKQFKLWINQELNPFKKLYGKYRFNLIDDYDNIWSIQDGMGNVIFTGYGSGYFLDVNHEKILWANSSFELGVAFVKNNIKINDTTLFNFNKLPKCSECSETLEASEYKETMNNDNMDEQYNSKTVKDLLILIKQKDQIIENLKRELDLKNEKLRYMEDDLK